MDVDLVNKVQVASGIGTCIASLCSATALYLIAGQYRQAKIQNSFLFLQKFLEDSRHLWAVCRSKQSSSQDFQIALGDVLGHLEFACVFLREEAATSLVSETVEETIIDYINNMNAEKYHDLCKTLLVHGKVCKHLRDFSLQRIDGFADPAGVRRMLSLSGS